MSDLPQKPVLDEKVEQETTPLAKTGALVPDSAFLPIGDDLHDPVSAFNETDAVLEYQLKEFDRYEQGVGDQADVWRQAYAEAGKSRVSRGIFLEELETKSFKPFVEHNGLKIAGRTDSLNVNANSEGMVSGDRAALRIQALKGRGQYRTFPLFSSGLIIQLRPIGDEALTDLHTLVAMERVKLGRLSSGLALANTSAYMVKHFIQMVMAHVVNTNIKDNDVSKIPSLMRISDLFALAASVAAVMYPKGFPVARPCTINPSLCESVDTYRYMPAHMLQHDEKKLTNFQKTFMTGGIEKKRTIKEIQDYQAAFDDYGTHAINDVEYVSLQDASIEDYLVDAELWFETIHQNVDELLMDGYDDEIRDKEVQIRGRQQSGRQYSHFVRSISYLETDGSIPVINDRETIAKVINNISGDEESLKKLIEHVRAFIPKSAVTITGLARRNCPVCQKNEPVETIHSTFVPTDTLQLFFTLTQQRLKRRRGRSLMEI